MGDGNSKPVRFICVSGAPTIGREHTDGLAFEEEGVPFAAEGEAAGVRPAGLDL